MRTAGRPSAKTWMVWCYHNDASHPSGRSLLGPGTLASSRGKALRIAARHTAIDTTHIATLCRWPSVDYCGLIYRSGERPQVQVFDIAPYDLMRLARHAKAFRRYRQACAAPVVVGTPRLQYYTATVRWQSSSYRLETFMGYFWTAQDAHAFVARIAELDWAGRAPELTPVLLDATGSLIEVETRTGASALQLDLSDVLVLQAPEAINVRAKSTLRLAALPANQRQDIAAEHFQLVSCETTCHTLAIPRSTITHPTLPRVRA